MSSTVTLTGLSVSAGGRTIVEPLDARIKVGECWGLIGESGSGKSMTARAIIGLLPAGVTAKGTVAFGDDVVDLSRPQRDAVWSDVRGRRAVLLLQDPFTSLSPVHRCGEQIAWSCAARDRVGASIGRVGSSVGQRYASEVAALLDELNLDAEIAQRFPHELSGGQRQRVAIAAAVATRPDLLIADEPTTALDASNQGEVLDLLRELQRRHGMAMMLISHDLGLIRGRADEIAVMKEGRVRERGATATILSAPTNEYTRALIAANPSIDQVVDTNRAAPYGDQGGSAPLLGVDSVTKTFGTRHAVDAVSFAVAPGEIVAVVGESGSGKSTLARCIAGLEHADSGTITLDGVALPPGRRGRTPGQMQIVFQDPYSTLNPVFSVRQTLVEALQASGRRGSKAEVDELLQLVGLDPQLASRRPGQLSGGQRQRVAIARALAPQPRVLICDEPVSALDVLVQEEILAMLARLRRELGLTVVFISHDLGVVAQLADRVAVMCQGKVVEIGSTRQVLTAPRHPYSARLASAARRDSLPLTVKEPGE